jgi:hypothetical protein
MVGLMKLRENFLPDKPRGACDENFHLSSLGKIERTRIGRMFTRFVSTRAIRICHMPGESLPGRRR